MATTQAILLRGQNWQALITCACADAMDRDVQKLASCIAYAIRASMKTAGCSVATGSLISALQAIAPPTRLSKVDTMQVKRTGAKRRICLSEALGIVTGAGDSSFNVASSPLCLASDSTTVATSCHNSTQTHAEMITREECEGIVSVLAQKCDGLQASWQSLQNRLRDLEFQSHSEPAASSTSKLDQGQPPRVDPFPCETSESSAGELWALRERHRALRLARKQQRREDRLQGRDGSSAHAL